MNHIFSLDNLFDYLDTLPAEMRRAMTEYLEHCEEHEGLPAALEAEKESGEAEEVKEDFLFAVIDQRHVIDSRPKRKWYGPNTRLGDRTGGTRRTMKRGVCFHHTGVKNGVGPHKTVVEHYRGLVDKSSGMLEPEEIISGVWGLDVRWLQVSSALSLNEWARAMALAGRMCGEGRKDKYNNGMPYQVVRCANSVLVLNLPFDWVTWASNGANNDFAAFGWDAKSTVESIDDADDLIADVEFVVKTMRDEGHPCTEFTGHCAYTNKPFDPGAEFILKVMKPAAQETGCVIDYDFKVRGARSLGEVLDKAA